MAVLYVLFILKDYLYFIVGSDGEKRVTFYDSENCNKKLVQLWRQLFSVCQAVRKQEVVSYFAGNS